MDTLPNIAYNIAEIVDKIDDSSVIERIKKLVHYYRALFIRRSSDKRDFIAQQFEQIIRGIEMIKVDSFEIEGYESENKIIRSKNPIPSAIAIYNSELFTYVGGIDLKTPFNKVQLERRQFLQYDKFSYSMPRYFIKNNYLYILNTAPAKMSIIGVFEDPTEIETFDEENDLYPCSSDMLSLIINSILSSEFKIDQSTDKEIEINDTKRGT